MPLYENTAVGGTEDIHKPIPVSQFWEYITQMRRDKNTGFAKHAVQGNNNNHKRLKFDFDLFQLQKCHLKTLTFSEYAGSQMNEQP